jgi:esterase/lipase superfamily enzyme
MPTLASVPGAHLETIYVATTRARAAADMNVFTTGRAHQTNYASFEISVPPTHQPGHIEWPDARPTPATSFTTVRQSVLDKDTFQRDMALQLKAKPHSQITVFVHGYNNNFQESLFRLAQLSADADLNGLPILFAWPSDAKLTGYSSDKESATYSRDELVDLLTMLSREPAPEKINVVAHSMGAWLAVEALRQLRLSGKNKVIERLNVILAAPDIDVDVFRAQMAVVGPLSPPITVLVSRDDIAMSFASRVAGDRKRVGALDVDDPRVQEAALKAKLQILDISSLQAPDGFNHDRFASLAALYPRLQAEANQNGTDLRQTGAFVFSAFGTTLSSPFNLAGTALNGE